MGFGEIVLFLGGISVLMATFDAFDSSSAKVWKYAGLKVLGGALLLGLGWLMKTFGV